jgi:3-deoxy-manno-octulosonate cytidylyltransferase (CMP-KDO synthetase)
VRTIIVIPARYQAKRLPGKPLADIHGKPMVQHVYELARRVPEASEVLVATDDRRVAAAVEGFGGRVEMTSPEHRSGTDRMAEVMRRGNGDIYVNMQCDEPLARPADIGMLLREMQGDESVRVATMCEPMAGSEAVNPNIVKVVRAATGDALYFSRAPIPFPRDGNLQAVRYLRHIGIYAFRREALARYASLPRPDMEMVEKLEQLRLLAAGLSIRTYLVEQTAPGVDTEKCLDRVRAIIAEQVQRSEG